VPAAPHPQPGPEDARRPRLPGVAEARFAAMSGSSIAAPDALGWVTDFLNAAYYARRPEARELEHLRLAFAVLTTAWARAPHRRLHVTDLAAFHRAFGLRRVHAAPRGTLGRDALLEGAAALLGDWFPAAVRDPARRAHGIAFPTREARAAFDPSLRLRHAPLGPLSPHRAPAASRRWHTYPAVALPRPEAALAFLRDPARWPDATVPGGRFTALRPGGLAGQTFEIEVNARPAPQLPIFTRGYVTCTAVLEPGPRLDAWVQDVTAALAAAAPGDPAPVPAGAEPLLGVELTTHDGHFLGRAVSRLVAYDGDAGAQLRDVGSWDPLPWYLAGAYAVAGRRAQEAFWGAEPAETSMLAQIARLTASEAAAPARSPG
jgi:hypothetical protein